MRVCIGGTFNILHKGHESLIDKAFKTAGKNGMVFIGITNGKMLNKKKNVKPFENRVKAINKYILSKGYTIYTEIKPIYNKYGPTINGEFDVIVVSTETFKTAEKINKKRIKNGKKPLIIFKIPMVLAEDKKPISATRIFNKNIDRKGKIKK